MDEEKKETEKKARGRPRKSLPTVGAGESDLKKIKEAATAEQKVPMTPEQAYEEAIRDIQAKIAELDEQLNSSKKSGAESEIATLGDDMPYPVEEEETAPESKPDFKMPETKEDIGFWRKIFKKSKMNKEGKVTVILLHHSTDADIHYVNIENEYGDFHINNEKYNVNEHCVYSLLHKKERYPLCILPTWTMIPIGTKAWFELSQERRGHELERIIINAIKKEEALKADEGKKKKMSGKTIWIIIGIIVIGYIFLKSRGAV